MFELIIEAIFITLSTVLIRIPIAKRIGHTGTDIHKPNKPEIAESVGIALLLASTYVLYKFSQVDPKLRRFLYTFILLGVIGIIDDFKRLGPKLKTALTILAGLPAIKAAPVYLDTIFGRVRSESIMKLGAGVGYAIYANAMNMIDSVNSVAVVGTAMILAYQTALLYYLNSPAFRLALAFLAIVMVYLPFNLYPAHAFNGDVGDFILGSMIFTVALYGEIVIPTLVASIPIITNGISFVLSVGIKTRGQFVSPTRQENCKLYPVFDRKAPKTLVRLFASLSCGASEKDIIKYYLSFFAISLALGVLIGVFYL